MSSSYIIEQFLPDAAALAAVTSAASQRKKKKNLSYLTKTGEAILFLTESLWLACVVAALEHRICGVNNAFSLFFP
ncbi:hypothetical protein Bca4012_079640 [Brassica carinata]